MIALALLLAAADGSGLQAALKSVKQDGPVQLSAEAQQDITAMLPPARKGEECPDAAVVAQQAEALKDRGDGAILVVTVSTCKGGRIYALSTGQPPRVARLIDQQTLELRSARALALGGGNKEHDLGLELLDTPTQSEMRLFSRSDTGFSFAEAGTLKEFNALRECGAGDEASGWGSSMRAEKEKLAVLRIDLACSGGNWQAQCILYRFDRGALARAGVCPLPPKLDAKSLKLAGWK